MGAVLTVCGVVAITAIPTGAVLANRRRHLGTVGWVVTAALFGVVAVGLYLWLSPVSVAGVTCGPSSAVASLNADTSVLLAPGATPLDVRLACASQAGRIVAAWGAAMGVALVAWGWFLGRHLRTAR